MPQPTANPKPVPVEKTVSVEHLLRLAEILESQGQKERARELYLTILKKDSKNPLARKHLGMPALNAIVATTQNVSSPKFPAGLDTDRPSLPGSTKPASTQSQVADAAKPFPGFKVETAIPAKPADKAPIVATGSKSGKTFRKITIASKPRMTTVRRPKLTPLARSGSEKTTQGTEDKTHADVPSIRIIPRSKAGAQNLSNSNSGRSNASIGRNITEESGRNGATGFPVDENPFAASSQKKQPAAIDEPKDPLPTMIAGLDSSQADQRAISAFRLGRRGAKSRAAIPHLHRALQNEKSGPVRIRLAEALVRIDRKNAKAFTILVVGLDSRNKNTRWEACCAAEAATRGTAQQQLAVVKHLTRLLHDLDPEIRTMAALKLGEFGETAKSAFPELRQVAKQGDDNLRSAATATLNLFPRTSAVMTKQ
ncbi:MAG: HEAT repeat domain-containing protein [Planctomycetes bacterium]|nr:HEAT repeat domain-containing protein [Planctomycetota bacterium]